MTSAVKVDNARHSVRQDTTTLFPVVGIGASAGGFDPAGAILTELPPDTGMAFVFVYHLDPTHESNLAQLLSRHTKMKVAQVRAAVTVKPNHVYVIPPNREMRIENGVLRLAPRPSAKTPPMPIDVFFASLALDRGNRAIGIVLSGTATDGTIGLQAIRRAGGITFAQTEQSAKYEGMPHSAIAAGVADFVLSPPDIARELARISEQPGMIFATPDNQEQQMIGEGREALAFIIGMLQKSTGVDFEHYKHNTIRRRIARRMTLLRLRNVQDYVQILKNKPSELDALYNDILINVTRFFRNEDVFEAIKKRVFPEIVKNKTRADAPVRIWVPGCSTGEEAYSLAICFLEFLEENGASTPVQIFATDISEHALQTARSGFYPRKIEQDFKRERLRRFFSKSEQGYRINNEIRNMISYARQNVATDPPFSQMDLISCRNMLIYMGTVMQKKVLPIFHYALKPNGFLLLGNAESLASYPDLFELVDRKNKIFIKQSSTFAALNEPGRMPKRPVFPTKQQHGEQKTTWTSVDLQREADRIILSKYGPPAVVINSALEIVQFRGRTGMFLEPAPGLASLNVLKMAREGLMLDLRTAIQHAKQKGESVIRENVPLKHNGGTRMVTIEAVPVVTPGSQEAFFLILFHEEGTEKQAAVKEAVGPTKDKSSPKKELREQIKLRRELAATREYLQAIIEEQEATNEKLKSANEEILSSNEELQSTNEELETAHEELQSSNEELTTLNEELQNRNEELNLLNDDLQNIIMGVNIPILIVNEKLQIRRFTPIAEKVLHLIAGDVGRNINDVRLGMDVPDLSERLLEVIHTLKVYEAEVQDKDGKWHMMRIRPYKTKDNRIAGAVVTFVEIEALKQYISELQESRDYIAAIVEAVRESLLVLDSDLRIKSANRSFYECFQLTAEKVENQWLYKLGKEWSSADLRKKLQLVAENHEPLQNYEFEGIFARTGAKTFLVNAVPFLRQYERQHPLILVSLEDVTEKRATEEAKRNEILLEEIHHRVKNNLQIISSLLFLQSSYSKDETVHEMFRESQNRVKAMAFLHEKLYRSGQYGRVNLREYIETLAHDLMRTYAADSGRVNLKIDIPDLYFNLDTAVPCGLMVNEIFTNSLKYAFPDGRRGNIGINIQPFADGYELLVADNGVGFSQPVEIEKAATLGLKLVSTLTRQLSGTLKIDSGKNGTRFTLIFREQATPDIRAFTERHSKGKKE